MDCFNNINYSGHDFILDHCANKITYKIESDTFFTRESLIELSKDCFNLYKNRLQVFSPAIQNIGKQEYNLINEELISLILPFEPLKFSFSITEEPSIHFFVRFRKKVSLFIEVYLDIEDGNDTYLQILKSNKTIYEQNCMFDNAVSDITKLLAEELDDSTFYRLFKNLDLCKEF